MESRNDFGTQWCPKAALSSNFFYCDEERTLKIDAKRLCDGHPDCPLSKADESSFVCSRDELRFIQTGKKIQGGFFGWSALKMTKYEEKLKYLNWSANCSSRKVLSVKPQ